MIPLDAFGVLAERRDYLAQRIIAKRTVGWETTYDERECEALTVVLPREEEVDRG